MQYCQRIEQISGDRAGFKEAGFDESDRNFTCFLMRLCKDWHLLGSIEFK